MNVPPKTPPTSPRMQSPPVYQPQRNAIAQTKAAGTRLETRPAPPVYRPSRASALQNSPAKTVPPAFRGLPAAPPHTAVQAPPAYRPASQPALQKRPGTGFGPPPVYRPDFSGPSVKSAPATGAIGANAVQSKPQPRPKPPASSAGQSAIQRYETLSATRIFTSEGAIDVERRKVAVIPDDDLNFVWQQKERDTFLGSSEEVANLRSATKKRLRVSDDFQMAIQDTDLSTTQPKVFYATDKVFQDSRTKLREVRSKFQLVKTSRVLTLWDGNSTRRRLTQLLPQKTEEPVDQPLMLRSKQACNEMSEQVTGTDNLEMYPTSSHLLPVNELYSRAMLGGLTQIAAVVAHAMGKSDGSRGGEVVDASTERELNRITQEIGVEYNQALSDLNHGKLDKILQYLKINQYASPDVGDAFVIGSVAALDDLGQLTDLRTGTTFVPKWPYHFGGVVAKSGSDTVTLENYIRSSEVEGNRASDPRWYFQMYGGGIGQSFHEANIALGGYANPVTTAQHSEARTRLAASQRLKRQRQRAALMKMVKVGLNLFVPVLLALVIFAVLRRLGRI
jgi:hypothetical protein